ncbi:hypothetical protein GC194_11060 [bacterium]|nr:hypothetical protein [bacterium]
MRIDLDFCIKSLAMKLDYIKSYGYCVVHTGTLLFRQAKDTNYYFPMFFGLRSIGAAGCGENHGQKLTQLWKAKCDFKVLFMVNDLSYRAHAESAIVDIYNSIFHDGKGLDDLDIKQHDYDKRAKLLKHLLGQGITGWLSSLENGAELELCLFDVSKLESMVEFVGHANDENKMRNALITIDVFPDNDFFVRTSTKIRDNTFDKYLKWHQQLVDEQIGYDCTDDEARQYCLNLRVKLEI